MGGLLADGRQRKDSQEMLGGSSFCSSPPPRELSANLPLFVSMLMTPGFISHDRYVVVLRVPNISVSERSRHSRPLLRSPTYKPIPSEGGPPRVPPPAAFAS